jgi:hypothetical protein
LKERFNIVGWEMFDLCKEKVFDEIVPAGNLFALALEGFFEVVDALVFNF